MKREGKNRQCDENCNECGILRSPNNKQLTLILNKLHNKFGDEAYKIIQDGCPNLTCCADCHIDDFCHIEGCVLNGKNTNAIKNVTAPVTH